MVASSMGATLSGFISLNILSSYVEGLLTQARPIRTLRLLGKPIRVGVPRTLERRYLARY